jgi:hypothetical protein
MKYYTILKWNNLSSKPNRVTIEATYEGHIWGSSAYEIVGYANTYRQAQKLATKARSE